MKKEIGPDAWVYSRVKYVVKIDEDKDLLKPKPFSKREWIKIGFYSIIGVIVLWLFAVIVMGGIPVLLGK